MPKVNGRHYPYTMAGKAAARRAAQGLSNAVGSAGKEMETRRRKKAKKDEDY
jgi:hypothetical protein